MRKPPAERTVKVTVTLPGALVAELRGQTDNISGFIADAAARELRRRRLLKAVEDAEGAWAAENHPELQSDEDVVRYVDRLRGSWESLQPR